MSTFGHSEATHDDKGYAHQSEELSALFIVLSCDLDGSSGEPVQVFGRACLLGFLALLFRLFSLLKTLG